MELRYDYRVGSSDISADAATLALLDRLEREVAAHPEIRAVDHPHLQVSRYGVTAIIRVKVGRSKKLSAITGDGDTAQAAVDDLLRRLDSWVEVSR